VTTVSNLSNAHKIRKLLDERRRWLAELSHLREKQAAVQMQYDEATRALLRRPNASGSASPANALLCEQVLSRQDRVDIDNERSHSHGGFHQSLKLHAGGRRPGSPQQLRCRLGGGRQLPIQFPQFLKLRRCKAFPCGCYTGQLFSLGVLWHSSESYDASSRRRMTRLTIEGEQMAAL
jgi:hypothetical protein